MPYNTNWGRRNFVLTLLAAVSVPGFLRSATATNHVNTRFDSTKLPLATGGTGDPLVFIHGFGSSKFTWRHLCDGLQDTNKYYAIDLPGSGTAPAPSDFSYSLESFSDVVVDFILRKNLTRVTLIGHSFGGGVALLALLRRNKDLASRVRALCIIGSIAYPQQLPYFVGLLRIPVLGPLAVEAFSPEIQVKSILNYCYFDESLITQEQIAEYASYFRRKEVREALVKTARLIDTDRLSAYVANLNTIKIPALLIWGREDRVVPVKVAHRLMSELPRAQLALIGRCGHMPQEERPRETISTIREFLISISKE